MKLTRYIYIVALAAAFTSCRKERDLTYTGPAVIEFDNPITGSNSKTTGQSIGGTSVLGDNANIPIRGDQDSAIVQLVSAQRSTPVTITYNVVPGTAVEGTDFTIVGTRGSVTIPANASSTAIRFKVLNSSTTPNTNRTVSFVLTGTNQPDVTISANYKTYAVTIYPMKAYLSKALTTASAYLSTANGTVYTAPTGNAGYTDIAFTTVTRTVGTTPTVFPALTGTVGSDTRFSARVFVPAATVPAYLQASWATTQLGAQTATTVAAIPTSGTTATAAINQTVEVVENGIYGFVNGQGKKGYIRIKTVSNTAVTLDVMVQP